MDRAFLKTKIEPADELNEGLPSAEELSPRHIVWRRFRRSPIGVIGLIMISLLYLSAIFADFLSPQSPHKPSVQHVHVPPQLPHFIADGHLVWPYIYDYKMTFNEKGLERVYTYDISRRHPLRFFFRGDDYKFLGLIPTNLHFLGSETARWYPLGSDRMGRDLLSRVLYGGRISLTVGLIGVIITTILGTVIGTVSGYFGGWVDNLIQRLIELLMSFPSIPLWMALAAALPPHWSPYKVYAGIVLILSLIGWGALARQVRGMVLSYRETDFVKAARSFGARDGYLIRRHLIPMCYGYLIVVSTLAIPGTILGETALSFLGLGIRAPMISWGVLLEEAQHVRVLVQFPWLLCSAIPVLVAVVAFNMMGDALRDALDPNTR